MTYLDKLLQAVKTSSTNLVIGLDTDMSFVPEFLKKFENPVREFNRIVIAATRDLAAGYKFNMAFYEYLQCKGIEALSGSLGDVPDHLIKICDAKRGDIDNTTELYAKTYFDSFGFDSITVSPYMGTDSVAPFIKREGKCVYVLALTSNPGSADFQFLKCNGKLLFEVVIEKFAAVSSGGNIGFVFGANHSAQISAISNLHPDVPILIPGIGAQENDLKELRASIHSNACIVNVSRSIISSGRNAADENMLAEAVRVAAKNYYNELSAPVLKK